MSNRYRTLRAKKIYKITDIEASIAGRAYDNLNTDKGYEAYAKLQMSIESRDGDDAILYDLAADFDWDGPLSEKVTELFKQWGYTEKHPQPNPDAYVCANR